MANKRSSWLRSIAVGIGIFVAWFAIGVLFYQESPGDKRTHPASSPGRRDSLPRSAQAATAALNCWFAFQFHGSRSATLLAG